MYEWPCRNRPKREWLRWAIILLLICACTAISAVIGCAALKVAADNEVKADTKIGTELDAEAEAIVAAVVAKLDTRDQSRRGVEGNDNTVDQSTVTTTNYNEQVLKLDALSRLADQIKESAVWIAICVPIGTYVIPKAAWLIGTRILQRKRSHGK